jgi:hypothetical protein
MCLLMYNGVLRLRSNDFKLSPVSHQYRLCQRYRQYSLSQQYRQYQLSQHYQRCQLYQQCQRHRQYVKRRLISGCDGTQKRGRGILWVNPVHNIQNNCNSKIAPLVDRLRISKKRFRTNVFQEHYCLLSRKPCRASCPTSLDIICYRYCFAPILFCYCTALAYTRSFVDLVVADYKNLTMKVLWIS